MIRGAKERAVEDERVIERINELAGEEHDLFALEARGDASEADVERLRGLEVTLDQCYDVLRQRRAAPRG